MLLGLGGGSGAWLGEVFDLELEDLDRRAIVGAELVFETVEASGDLVELTVHRADGSIDGRHPGGEKVVDSLCDLFIDLGGDSSLDLLDHRRYELAKQSSDVAHAARLALGGLFVSHGANPSVAGAGSGLAGGARVELKGVEGSAP